MSGENDKPTAADERSAATNRGIRPRDVIKVPEGIVGKPQAKHEFGFEPPFLPPNWITYVSVEGPQLITHFESSWQVPHPPAFNNGQLVYLFNGLQNPPKTQILQPVLQWGVAPWGGGFDWRVIPVFVDASTGHVQIPQNGLIPVPPGAIVTGYTQLLNQAGGHCTYECGFRINGVPGPKLQMLTDQMVEAVEVLEAYAIMQAGNYPNQPVTSFSAPQLVVTAGPVQPNWAIFDKVVNYGQHAVTWPDKHVDIHYGMA